MNSNKTSLATTVSQTLPETAFIFSQADLEKLKSFSAVALAIIGALGIVAVAVVAPNIFKVAKSIPKLRKMIRATNKPKETITKTFYYLKKHDYIKLTKSGKNYLIEITEKGKKKFQRMSFENLKIPTEKKWDNGWWIILADIPKDYRYQADLLRQKIKDLGFYMLQRTAWVYPFDPRKEIAFISAYYGIAKFLTVVKTCSIDEEDNSVLKHHFRLKYTQLLN